MDMAELGAAASEKKRSPVSDEIKQREAFRWLKTLGMNLTFWKVRERRIVHKRKEKAFIQKFSYHIFQVRDTIRY